MVINLRLVMAQPEEGINSRGRSSSLSRASSLRKHSLSRLRSRSRSRSRLALSCSSTSQDGLTTNRIRQLKRMEIILVKRGPYVMVLPETLGLIKTMREIPVTGFTKYFFQLEEQKVMWASKYRKRWQGFELDGTRLLNGNS
jgi:hypothetical protein